MGYIEDQSRAFSEMLVSIRQSVERSLPTRAWADPGIRKAHTELLGKIEALRIGIGSFHRFRRKPSDGEWHEALEELRDGLIEIHEDPFFQQFAANARYRNPNVFPGRRSLPNPIQERFGPEPIPVAVALEALIEDIYAFDLNPIQAEMFESGESQKLIRDVERLKKIVPEQKIAPLVFDIIENRLVIIDVKGKVLAEDQSGTTEAREALFDQGKIVIEQLQNSNCDQRFLEKVVELNENLSTGNNIIRLGLLNATCSMMCNAFSHELPQAVCALIRAQTAGIGMYLAQFPEWARFSENAASVTLDDNDIKEISKAATELASNLQGRTDIAAAEIPKTLLALEKLIHSPGEISKRAAFAVLRSIENLISRIFKYGIDFVEKSIQKTINDASTLVAKVAVVALLTVALGGAAHVVPVASKTGDAPWMQNAVDLVSAQLKELKN